MNVYVINGYPRSGKDSFVDFCLYYLNENAKLAYELSTITFIKLAARSFGWDGQKDSKSRKMLSELKRVLAEWNDVPYQDIVNKIEERKKWHTKESGEATFFIFTREPDEIERFVKDYQAKTVLIKRPDNDINNLSNDSDKNVLNIKYDFVIQNDGSLEKLKEAAYTFLKEENLI